MTTMQEIVAANKARKVGGHFFDADTMQFFLSRYVKDPIREGEGGIFFVMSEQFEFRGKYAPRKYSVRQFMPDASIDTVGQFQRFDTAGEARAMAAICAAGPAPFNKWEDCDHEPKWTEGHGIYCSRCCACWDCVDIRRAEVGARV